MNQDSVVRGVKWILLRFPYHGVETVEFDCIHKPDQMVGLLVAPRLLDST
jgi:hypothetical protein